MHTSGPKPYCIWYYLGSEDTYRRLARRYPEMRYHVGRACAAAGYAKLYFELDLLPDISIAEEARDARDSGAPDVDVAGADAIFRAIVEQPVSNFWFDDGGGQYGYAWTKGYNRIAEEMARWELYVCAPDGLRERAAVAGGTELYWEWNMIDTWRDSLPWNHRDEGKEDSKQ
ncbi:hypothetical protein K4K53_008089 [Colletotrichum sp. SAR 10_77]|nr:hypothetical protein K4K53_008089 [Colletotrichum sp. SAR 10_77]